MVADFEAIHRLTQQTEVFTLRLLTSYLGSTVLSLDGTPNVFRTYVECDTDAPASQGPSDGST